MQLPNKGLLDPTITLTPGPLAQAALAELREFFQIQTTHRPSPAMWAALTDLMVTLEQMAEGSALPYFYLSSLDPGVGKSEAVAHFVRTLVRSDAHRNVGVLICVSRLAEVEAYVKRMKLPESDYAVFTADDDMNKLGSGSPATARVLFTTQQMLERRCKDKLLLNTEVFGYLGQRRQVRIWDESILPGRVVTVSRDDIASLFKPLRRTYPALTEALYQLFGGLAQMADGTLYDVPDFSAAHGVEVNEVLRLLNNRSNSDQAAASALWLLSGKTVVVRRDGAHGNTLLSYEETLPSDLAPILVLDASGRVRGTYDEWERGRRTLRRLATAEKSYRNLTIHVWERGGGKNSFARAPDTLADGIASTINTKPGEEWLIVCHQPNGQFDVEASVRSLLQGDQRRVHFITWGNHHATNQFRDVKNVILAGTLFYRPSYYESTGRLSSGRSPASGPYPEDAIRHITQGEHRHLILQAACRGSVRQCDGDACWPCDVYIIASAKNGIPASLPAIFPGCTVKAWRPLAVALTGKVKLAIDYIKKTSEKAGDRRITFQQVMNAINMRGSSNFRARIRQHPDFVDALTALGMTEHGRGFARVGLLVKPSEEPRFPYVAARRHIRRRVENVQIAQQAK